METGPSVGYSEGITYFRSFFKAKESVCEAYEGIVNPVRRNITAIQVVALTIATLTTLVLVLVNICLFSLKDPRIHQTGLQHALCLNPKVALLEPFRTSRKNAGTLGRRAYLADSPLGFRRVVYGVYRFRYRTVLNTWAHPVVTSVAHAAVAFWLGLASGNYCSIFSKQQIKVDAEYLVHEDR